MAPKTKKLTEGAPLPLLLRFSLPLMAGNIFQQLYTVVDTMIVGKALGVDALAALGASDWVNWMVLGIIQGFTQGFGILMAKEFGANRLDSLRRVVGSSYVLAGLSAILLLGITQAGALPLLELLQTPKQIMPGALLYLRVMFFGIPIVMAYNLLACILRALGDSKTPLMAMVVAALSNIALDLLFVLVFHWGIAGAASATLIAQLISSIYCYGRLRKISFMHLQRGDFHLTSAMAGQLMQLGLPMALQNTLIAVGGMIIQRIVNGFGVVFLAGFTATNKLYGILEVAALSYGYAMVTYVGQNVGARKPERIRSGMKSALLLSVATSLVIMTVMIVFGRLIVASFISGTPEQMREATRIAYTYLCVMSGCLPILYVLFIVRSAIQGMGNTVLPMLSGIAELIMRTSGVLLLPALLGEFGIYISEVLAWTGADMVLIPSYIITFKKIKKKLELE